MKKELFLASVIDGERIAHLRMQEYSKASGFELDLATLRWKQSDNESFILAARLGDEIVSTMRGEVINDLSLLEKKLECPWTFTEELKLPVLLLSRAATHSDHRSEGLNLILRHWFLEFAKIHQIPYVLGTFVSNSPREKSLREMGYDFFENTLGWQQSSYKSIRPVQVVALDMAKKGNQAICHCQQKVAKGILEYSYGEEMPELKFVECL